MAFSMNLRISSNFIISVIACYFQAQSLMLFFLFQLLQYLRDIGFQRSPLVPWTLKRTHSKHQGSHFPLVQFPSSLVQFCLAPCFRGSTVPFIHTSRSFQIKSKNKRQSRMLIKCFQFQLPTLIQNKIRHFINIQGSRRFE